jgi:hypothetical protein
MNLTKEMKDLYMDKYETQMEETKENINKCKDILRSKTIRIDIIKMSILPKTIYRFNQSLSKFQ